MQIFPEVPTIQLYESLPCERERQAEPPNSGHVRMFVMLMLMIVMTIKLIAILVIIIVIMIM